MATTSPHLRLALCIILAVVAFSVHAEELQPTDTFSPFGYGYNSITGSFATNSLINTTTPSNTEILYQNTTYIKPAFITDFYNDPTPCTLSGDTTVASSLSAVVTQSNGQMQQKWLGSSTYQTLTKALLETAMPAAKSNVAIAMWGTGGDVIPEITNATRDAEYDFYSTTLQCTTASITPRTIDPPLSTDFIEALSTLPDYYVPNYGVGAYAKTTKPAGETRSATYNQFSAFFNAWGTHYYHQLDIGASFSVVKSGKRCELAQKPFNKVDVRQCLHQQSTGQDCAYINDSFLPDLIAYAVDDTETIGTPFVSGGDDMANVTQLVGTIQLFTPQGQAALSAWANSTTTHPGIVNYQLQLMHEFVAQLGKTKSDDATGVMECEYCHVYPNINYTGVAIALRQSFIEYTAANAYSLYNTRQCTRQCSKCDTSPFADCKCCIDNDLTLEGVNNCCAGATPYRERIIFQSYRLKAYTKKNTTSSVRWEFDIGDENDFTRRSQLDSYISGTPNIELDRKSQIEIIAKQNALFYPTIYGEYSNSVQDALDSYRAHRKSTCDNTWRVDLDDTYFTSWIQGNFVLKVICADPQYIGENCDKCKAASCSNNSASQQHNMQHYVVILAVIIGLVVMGLF